MQKVRVLVAALLLCGTAASAQMKVKPKAQPLQKNVQSNASSFLRITRDDAFKLYSQGKAVFIDVRSNEQFSYGHIRGALSIPNSQLIGRFSEVTPGKTVITYCACDAEQSSGRAAVTLQSHGVKGVYALKGGWVEWKAAGLPIAAGPK